VLLLILLPDISLPDILLFAIVFIFMIHFFTLAAYSKLEQVSCENIFIYHTALSFNQCNTCQTALSANLCKFISDYFKLSYDEYVTVIN